MATDREEREIYNVFKVSLFIKGVDGLLEICGSILLFTLSPERIRDIIFAHAHKDLLQDPTDLISNYLMRTADHLSANTEMFGAIYLLAHGAVKIFLVVALLQKRMWAYPTALVVFGAFAVYELYRYTHTHSPVLLVLMAFELFVIWLIWREYGIVKTKPLVIGQ